MLWNVAGAGMTEPERKPWGQDVGIAERGVETAEDGWGSAPKLEAVPTTKGSDGLTLQPQQAQCQPQQPLPPLLPQPLERIPEVAALGDGPPPLERCGGRTRSSSVSSGMCSFSLFIYSLSAADPGTILVSWIQ